VEGLGFDKVSKTEGKVPTAGRSRGFGREGTREHGSKGEFAASGMMAFVQVEEEIQ
jgi:hypothetical protein